MKNKYTFIFVGDKGVGKRSLIHVIKSDVFPDPTFLNEYNDLSTNLLLNELTITFTIEYALSDLIFNQKLKFIGHEAFAICFSLDNPDSLDHVIKTWYPGIKKYFPKIPCVLLGLRSDLRDGASDESQIVSQKSGEEVREQIGAHYYFECSSKLKNNVREPIDFILSLIQSRKQRKQKKCYIE